MRSIVRLFSLSMVIAMLFSTVSLSTIQSEVAAQPVDVTSAGFVSGSWRVIVLQTVVAPDVAEAGLDPAANGSWAVAIADVTNTGVTTTFDPATLTLGATSGSPLSMTDGVAADVVASATASQALKLEGVSPEGTFTVPENGTIRMAVVFPLAAEPADGESLVMRLNDQVMRISNTTVDTLAVADLPALMPEMQLQVADITTAVGGGKIDVTLRSGGTATIDMDAVIAPEADANITSSCYAGETASQTMNLTGGTVWIEEVPGTGTSLVWFNDPAAANFGLLNAHLIAGGFAGADPNADSPYMSWLGAVQEYAKSQETGLWSLCKDASGTWIKQPAPTPVPTQSPEQVRAQYQWVDTRDLVIRPGEFDGDKIAVSGSVFNIDVEGGLTVMQIWLDGGSEAAVIVYFGDTRGIYEGTWITVYGTGDGTFTGTNAFGGTIVQPMIAADIVDW